jgi:apolipoprotein D and lipocalin family protein
VGSDLDYFWLLSRDKTLSPELRAQLVAQAKSIGVRTEKLIWVDQSASQKDPKTTP